MAEKRSKKRRLRTILCVILAMIFTVVLIVVPPMFAETIDNSFSICSHTENSPMMVAHRGLSSLAPQNSLASFRLAAEYGYDGYEFDIQTTKDGQWVVIHDLTVDKMTNGTGNVKDYTLAQLKELTLDGGNGLDKYPSEKVPTLDEALSVCSGYDIIPVVEIKDCDEALLPELKETLERHNVSDKAVIISFHREYLEKYRELDENAQMLLVSSKVEKEDIDWCIEYKAGINYFYGYLYRNASALAYARENGVKIGVWTVDNLAFEDVAVLFGAEIVTTNKILP